VYVREYLDDIRKRLSVGCFGVDRNDFSDAAGNIFEMVDQFDTVMAVLRWMRVPTGHQTNTTVRPSTRAVSISATVSGFASGLYA